MRFVGRSKRYEMKNLIINTRRAKEKKINKNKYILNHFYSNKNVSTAFSWRMKRDIIHFYIYIYLSLPFPVSMRVFEFVHLCKICILVALQMSCVGLNQY